MMDQLIDETIVSLQPDSMIAEPTTQTLRDLMRRYRLERPPRFWATMVSTPHWRADRPEMIRMIAGYGWSGDTDGRVALVAAELHVMAIEAVAGLWEPHECKISAVRIDGKPVVSLVCSAESVGREQRD